jgi:methylmalonyl-CoA carboxyltransferase large subunit
MAMENPQMDTDVSDLLDRIAELEERMRKIEAERDAALAAAPNTAATILASVVPAPATAAPVQASAAPSTAAVAPSAPKGEATEEILMVISAAVAAFLGKRAHVRQIRYLGSPAWVELGRVSVMASHRWAMHRG